MATKKTAVKKTMAKKGADRSEVDRFTSDGYGVTVERPNAAKKKKVDAMNRKTAADIKRKHK